LESTSKQEYISRINRVVDYIKSNLDGDLSLDRLSGVAHFSKFYFHRIFKAIMEENLNSFVGRMRIERSAYRLIHNPRLPITAIALDSGFSSSAVYSREFKKYYKMTPTEWRKKGELQKSKICKLQSKFGEVADNLNMYIDSSTQQAIWRVTMQNKAEFNIEVRHMPEIPIAYVRHNGFYSMQDKALFQSLFARLFAWAVPRNLFNPPATNAMTVFSSGHPDVTEPENLSVDVCISIDKEINVDGEIGKRVLSKGQYAVVTLIEATIEECSQGWDALFNRWLPNSGFQPGDGAYYINHLNNPEEHPEKRHSVEIYLPVKPL
jgi:AraC family transcriptional regulator